MLQEPTIHRIPPCASPPAQMPTTAGDVDGHAAMVIPPAQVTAGDVDRRAPPMARSGSWRDGYVIRRPQ